MRIAVIAASARQPEWVRAGFDNYARRLRGSVSLDLIEVPLARRSRTVAPAAGVEREGEKMLAVVPKGAHVVTLDEKGVGYTTAALAGRLDAWITRGGPVALLIGGPDGLARACRERADESWALSAMTLPHGIVRILVAESIYRALSLRQGHPYHRD